MTPVNRWKKVAFVLLFTLAGSTQLLVADPTNEDKADRATAQAGASVNPQDASGITDKDEGIAQSSANLRELMSAIHTYHDIAGHYPLAHFGIGYDKQARKWFLDRPYLSWRVMLLPLLGERVLFDKFKLDEPWDSEHNRQLVPLMPAVYRAPKSKAEVGKTNYLGVVGPNAAFAGKEKIAAPDFVDGTVYTIMLVEASDKLAVEWTRPADFPMDTNDAEKSLVGLRDGGFLTAFADGSPRFISSGIPSEKLNHFFVRNDRRVIGDTQRWVRFVSPEAFENIK